jgi:addiction module HigA family antidote
MTEKILDPIPPGEILLEDFMKPLGISMNKLARDIDVPPNRISAVVGGKRAITADTALRLAKYFGTSPDVWIGLQKDYELRVAMQTTWPEVESHVHILKAA